MLDLNVIHQGDCLELMKEINDKSIDLILCDPPYGTTDCKWDTVIPFELLWEQYNRIIKDKGAILLFSQQPFTTDLINSNRKFFRYELIWEKNRAVGFLNAKKMPLRCHEVVLVFYKKLPTYNPQMSEGKPYKRKVDSGTRKATVYRQFKSISRDNTGTRYPRDVIRINGGDGGSYHPTQKSVFLLEYLIKTYTNKFDTVLDNCSGSGSTGVACVNTDRKFICIEKGAAFVEMSRQRVEGARRKCTGG
ncbi:DNA-methyltransferase [Pelosinus propionicus]|uniref:Methyltransferase n=1 Tax=Pelosinus propionicus DSM 13327 TaxID=1123291 RepID=A0A1I4N1Z8_9FIRM|nr:site-specific DNA-methyltransferase [Pelosinus propionicus]SFM09346.1 DNA modification methylase [Pelosinus propionicus DSM 13327]